MKNLEVLKFVSQQLPCLTQGINNNRNEKEEETNKHYLHRQMTNKWSRNYENNVIRYLDIAYNLLLHYETALVYYFFFCYFSFMWGKRGGRKRGGVLARFPKVSTSAEF